MLKIIDDWPTISHHFSNFDPAIVCHETQHGEDDEPGKDAGAAVDARHDQGISRKSNSETIMIRDIIIINMNCSTVMIRLEARRIRSILKWFWRAST